MSSSEALLCLVFLVGFCHSFSDSDYPWTYTCAQNTLDGPSCQRKEIDSNSAEKVPLNICILTCGKYRGLWPYPSGETALGTSLTGFTLDRLVFVAPSIPNQHAALIRMINETENIFFENLKNFLPEQYTDPVTPLAHVNVQLKIKNLNTKLTLDTDEAYNLTITNEAQTVDVTITASTFFGARHGLETLAQLIEYNTELKYLQIINQGIIQDKPTFPYRGLLLDTARNFIPIPDLKRMIDGLSYNKMNIFHWHITDSNSFPFYTKRVPRMVKYGTYSSQKIYYPEQVGELIEYANQRGVKIVPELDAPAHAGNGWQWGEKEGLGELSLCVNAEPSTSYCIQPPCGQLNPLNENTYKVLGKLFEDFLDVFDRDIFHMGGDEISFKCWLKYPHIQSWLNSSSGSGIMDLWGLYQQTALTKLKEANQGKPINAIVWTSEMTRDARHYLDPKDYIIQIWSKAIDKTTKGIFDDGYRVIFSNNDTVYLDHGYGPWRGNYVNPSVPIKTWQVIYSNDLIGQVEKRVGKTKAKELFNSGKILGGVATLWSEKADRYNMDMKLWPRGAAYAERLWSNPPSRLNVTQLAYPRLIHQRERLTKRGLHADTLLPEACYNIWGFCDHKYF